MVLRLLLILIAFVILLRLLGWRPPADRRSAPAAPAGPRDRPEGQATRDGDLVQCAVCAVYLPRQQALAQEGRWYCCAEHRDRR